MTSSTNKLIFNGASDDLVEVSGAVEDEFMNTSGSLRLMVAGPDYGALFVHASYTGDGVWMLGVSQVDEDHAIPSWPVSIVQSRVGYSVGLVIDVPAGASVTDVSLGDTP